ncbi:MAG: metallo-mystery pair system four-Cys motif protein [Gammaproteobacteria bacterium]|nr:metallo-mystery pair system four-Cys motif protein [Gammaproteobacteria bacterium]
MLLRPFAALTAAAICASCSQWDQPVNIPFVATWQGGPIDCLSEESALTDLRFYVSNVQLVDAEGQGHDVRFATEMTWQNDAVAYIDLEDGTGSCRNGTADTYDHVVGVAGVREYHGLRFSIGVPFRLNHANPLTAKPPLDDPDMHWHWRSGYKFLRAGVRTDDDGFWIHAGSAGCQGTVGNITDCKFPNRIDVFLPDFVVGKDSVNIELTELLRGVDLGDATRSDCSSGPPEISCRGPFAALGIDFTTGEQSGAQRVFSVQ